ncbi:MAG: hypothetical protein A2W93_10610 [Bacteroidetes bacterium GWF2_43_63]|nr:MAG: hypothetical protein A2W94_01860 [Bacteroidetes bacterium GWE2_42_42]OFY53006.1 MAG: hypothetical protein A2W93_10610 [Bacteroidetes bacterium GWF2_43_63]HCB62213.1 CAP domain-containing protein [Bacteroidales bacterium]
MRTFFLLLALFIVSPVIHAQTDTSLRAMNEREIELYRQIMEYRSKKRLKSIPVSSSLTKVAQCHVRDLNNYPPAKKCGMHSWSENGPWKPVCYDAARNGPELMWSKPSELTSYIGRGYENSFWTTDTSFRAEDALAAWKSSPPHNSVIINLGMWKDSKWKAIGLAAEGNYAVVWFGENEDPAGNIDLPE